MRAFLNSLDEKVWQAVEIGWTKPKEEFKKISSTETAKKAWPSSKKPMKELRLSRI